MSPGPSNEPARAGAPYRGRELPAIAARWDAKAERWDRDLQDPACHLNEDRAYERFLEHLASVIEPRRGFCAHQGAIDAGCATGLVLARLIGAFAWGVGVDLSPKMIRRARAKQIPRAQFLVGDCFQLASLCPKAGAVFSRGVLLSHYGPEHALDLIAGFRAVLVDHGFALWDFLNQTGRAGSSHVPDQKAYFDGESVCELARKAGFASARVLGEPARRVGVVLAECG